MEILNGFLDAIKGIYLSSGLVSLDWQNYVMIAISCFLLFLASSLQQAGIAYTTTAKAGFTNLSNARLL